MAQKLNKKCLPRFFENVFAQIQALILGKHKFFFFILAGVYLGRENQRNQRMKIEKLKNKKNHQEIMDEQ